MRSFIFVFFNFYSVFQSVCAGGTITKKLESETSPILVGDIDVYDVEQSTVRLVIPVNKKDYVQTNYLVLFENNNTKEIKEMKDVTYMTVFDSLVMFISGLSPSTTYQFCIVDKSRDIFFKSPNATTKKALLTFGKLKITLLNVTNTTCTFKWKKPANNDGNVHYNISVMDRKDGKITTYSKNSNFSDVSFMIDKLHPGKMYIFSVWINDSSSLESEEIECETLSSMITEKPAIADINLFNISFDYGMGKIALNDNFHFNNCAVKYYVYILKKGKHDPLIVMDKITCWKYVSGPFYFEVGNYNVIIKACNKIGCSREVSSKDYKITVKRKEPEPLSYKVLETMDFSCRIQWVKQEPNISIIREETIEIITDFALNRYKINFIVIGSDDNVLNIHTAKDACVAQHLKIIPAVPKKDEFDISIVDNVATIKLHNSRYNYCERWYKISLGSCKLSLYTYTPPVYLYCTDESVKIEKLNTFFRFKFQFVACNKNGCSSAGTSECSTTYKLSDKVFGPDGNLEILSSTDTTCKIQWTKPKISSGNVDYYIKYYINGNLSSEVFENFRESISKPLTEIQNLQPGIKYNIKVGAIKGQKMSKKTVDTICDTQHTKDIDGKFKGWAQISKIEDSRIELTIPFNKNTYLQPDISVLVEEKNSPTFIPTDDFSYERSKFLVVNVSELKARTLYRFRVVDKRNRIYFESNDVKTIDKIFERAGNIKIYKVEHSVVWLMIPIRNNEYLETDFLVFIKKDNISKFKKTDNVIYMQAVDTLVIFVSGLSLNTKYQFKVENIRKYISYESTEVTTKKNALGAPSKPMENMFYISFEKNEAILTTKEHCHWKDIQTWYRIQLLQVDGNNETFIETAVLDSDTNSNHFTNLIQGRKYKFRIKAQNRMGISESIDTREYIAGNYKRPIEVLNFTDTTCTILWKKPANAIKDMVNYIHVIDQGDRNIKTSYMLASPGIPFTIVELQPGNKYAFAISTEEPTRSPFVETDCTTTPVKVIPEVPKKDNFNISFEHGVVKIKFNDYFHYKDCEKVYNVFIHKNGERNNSVVYDRITCRNYKVGPYYFEPGTYFIMIQTCHTSTGCSALLRSRNYTIVKRKEPTPLSYKVLQTTENSCTIEWMKKRNISDIHSETIRFSKNSLRDGYEINFIIIGTDIQPLNIHTAKDACIGHHLIVIPAKPKESDFDITLHRVDPLLLKPQNIATIKLHNSTNNNCELWYTIQMCISSGTCFDKKILKCNKDLNIAHIFKPEIYYFIIAACNKIGCSQPRNTKLYVDYNPSDKLCGPEGPIQILNVTNTSCTIEWELPKNSFSCQIYDNVNTSTSHFEMYYIHTYIKGESSFEAFTKYKCDLFCHKPSYTINRLRPGSNYNIELGILINNDKSTKSISTECHTLFS
ncbi:titin-like isoform X2 [Leptopilina heterotoma]|uniref:titin-like isoform X2 n=1 Tax=Leptopilina heterotoma TaxID=63436 RepID=UPI001CA7CA66|nr:titin-like isoform X2 [Leptopilina heterotoma]